MVFEQIPEGTLLLEEQPKAEWLQLDHDGDILQAALEFVRRALDAAAGNVQTALEDTNFLFPSSIDDVPQFDLTEFGAAWLGGWNTMDAPRVVEELARLGEFDDTMLLLVRYIFNAFPQGILVFGSKLNHSCDPNVAVASDGMASSSLRFITTRPIALGEALSISYLQWHSAQEDLGGAGRQKQLRARWAFECRCAGCH